MCARTCVHARAHVCGCVCLEFIVTNLMRVSDVKLQILLVCSHQGNFTFIAFSTFCSVASISSPCPTAFFFFFFFSPVNGLFVCYTVPTMCARER